MATAAEVYCAKKRALPRMGSVSGVSWKLGDDAVVLIYASPDTDELCELRIPKGLFPEVLSALVAAAHKTRFGMTRKARELLATMLEAMKQETPTQ